MKVRKDLVKVYSHIVERDSPIIQRYTRWYDSYTVFPLHYYFPIQLIEEFKTISKSVRDIMDKYKDVEKIMNLRGFKLMKGGGGTNRRVYECVYDPRVLAKISLDVDGQNATIRDFMNQNLSKPFCSKIFEIDPTGTVSIIEKLVPIMTIEEWCRYAPDIYDILWYGFRGRNLGIEDAGDSRIKNWGYRNGFGPALLDFPSVYKLDPSKNRCRKVINGHICGGTIDYDDGFNKLICTSCGERYFAKNLAVKDDKCLNSLGQAMNYTKSKFFKEDINMKFTITDVSTGFEEVRGNTAKTNNVNNRRSFDNKKKYNVPITREHKVKKLHFTIEDVEPEEKVEESSDTTPQITAPVVNNVETVKTMDTIFSLVKYPAISRALNKTQYTTIDNMIQDFNDIITNTALEYETDSNQKTPANLVKIIKSRMTGDASVIPMPKLVDLYREIIKDTLTIPPNRDSAHVTNNNLDTTMFSSVGRMIDGIYTGMNLNRFDAFVHLINTVRNTASFFEGIVAFYNYIINRFSYDIDEEPGGIKTYKLNKEVYELMSEKIQSAIDDYLFNVRYNFKNLSYNMENEFTFFREGLEELKKYDDFMPGNWYCELYMDPEYYNISIEKNAVDEEEMNDVTIDEDSDDTILDDTTGESGETEEPKIQVDETIEEIDEEENETEEEAEAQTVEDEVYHEEVSYETEEENNEEEVSDDTNDVYIPEPNYNDAPGSKKKLSRRERRRLEQKKKYKAMRDEDESYEAKKLYKNHDYNHKQNSKYDKKFKK